ncbi:MAG: F-box protein, partial [Chlamydiia bacterium]|nr:F-box protein [Chlamydiia bacterium]
GSASRPCGSFRLIMNVDLTASSAAVVLPELPSELWARVFSFADAKSLAIASCICRAWRSEALRVMERAVREITIFSGVWGEPYDEKGKEWESWPWKQAFIDMQRMPDLMLVRVPKISIVAMGQLVKERRGVGYPFIWDRIVAQHGTQVDEPRWVLMTGDVLAGSRNQPYTEPKEMARRFEGYDVPTLREAIACIFARFLQDGARHFGDNPWTYTRCQENMNSLQTVVGGFAPAGLLVYNVLHFPHDEVGVAAMRKFQAGSAEDLGSGRL